MDQDSGRGTGRSVPRRENRAGPRHRLDTDRPPSGAANPLPRRSAQGHIEPQLRMPGGAGTGTPFTAFATDGDLTPGGGSGVGATTAGAVTAGAADGDIGRATDSTPEGATQSGSASASDGNPADAAETSAAADFHEGARRGRSAEPPAR